MVCFFPWCAGGLAFSNVSYGEFFSIMNFRKGFYWEKETVASNIVTSQKEIPSSNHPFSGAFAVSFREGNHRRPVKPVFWLQLALMMIGCCFSPHISHISHISTATTKRSFSCSRGKT